MNIPAAIGSATQQPFQLAERIPIGGGCINQSYCFVGQDGRRFFVKLNSADRLPMFAAEAAGLRAIAATQAIRVPQVITHGLADPNAFLVLEHLNLNGHDNAALLGEQLAALHRCPGKQFGFAQDNFIGSTPQPNIWTDDWPIFWREQRLGFQLRLAAQNGYGGQLQRLGEKLLDALPVLFAGHTPQPSLLHGDLWGGNLSFLADGVPAVFDPATYYGDRECDLAMTELFGGLGTDFYAAYRATYPLDAGYADRRDLYNLYHILNHINLFGGSYVRQAEQMMAGLIAKIS